MHSHCARGLVNGDAISQVVGNHTTELGAPQELFPLPVYIQETAFTMSLPGLRLLCHAPWEGGRPAPVSTLLKSHTSAAYWWNINHISISGYIGAWEIDREGLGKHVSSTKSNNSSYYCYLTESFSKRIILWIMW